MCDFHLPLIIFLTKYKIINFNNMHDTSYFISVQKNKIYYDHNKL